MGGAQLCEVASFERYQVWQVSSFIRSPFLRSVQ